MNHFEKPLQKVKAETGPKWLSFEEANAKLLECIPPEHTLLSTEVFEGEDGSVKRIDIATRDENGDEYLYVYQRQGAGAQKTTFVASYYSGKREDDAICGGNHFADYDETTGEWTLV